MPRSPLSLPRAVLVAAAFVGVAAVPGAASANFPGPLLPPAPELAPSATARLAPKAAKPGGLLRVSGTIRNAGPGAAPSTRTAVVLVGPGGRRFPLGAAATAGMPAGGAARFTLRSSAPFTPGTYRALVCADVGEFVREVDEGNNCRRVRGLVRVVPAADTRVPVPTAGGVLSASPTAIDFGYQREGVQSTDAKVVTITNTGTAETGIIRFTFLNAARSAWPEDFHQRHNGCVGRTLAPGASCEIHVVFLSFGYGAHQGYLQVSADGNNRVEVSLKGSVPLP